MVLRADFSLREDIGKGVAGGASACQFCASPDAILSFFLFVLRRLVGQGLNYTEGEEKTYPRAFAPSPPPAAPFRFVPASAAFDVGA